MNYIISASTDIGYKKVNQDSLFVRRINSCIGEVVFAVLCDGMGGLQKGEIASSSLTIAFTDWMYAYLPSLLTKTPDDSVIKSQWINVIAEQNDKLRIYSQCDGLLMGSTITMVLITENRYYMLNIGDTRAYEINSTIRQISIDHTVASHEANLGNMTEIQAEQAPYKNVLTKCVGITDEVLPDMFFGEPQKNTVYLLCSDGFRHKITDDEILEKIQLNEISTEDDLKHREEYLINLNKQRGETDNISVITIAVL